MDEQEKQYHQYATVLEAAHAAATLALRLANAVEPDTGLPAISVVQAIKSLATLEKLVRRFKETLN